LSRAIAKSAPAARGRRETAAMHEIGEPLPPPERLRCDYLENPLGIDAARPRLSWIVPPGERGRKPAACRVLAGLSPRAPGWRRIGVRPHPVGDIRFVKSDLLIPFGRVCVAWHRENGVFRLDVTVPPGAEAEVDLPVAGPEPRVTESGVEVFPAADPRVEVRAESREPGRARLLVGAGDYRFETPV
jgi:hypothetical protein